MDIRTISDIVYSNPTDRERMEDMNNVYYRMADYIKTHDVNAYDMFLEQAEDVIYRIDIDKAHIIVGAMTPYGQRWSKDEIRTFIQERGVRPESTCHYYLVMNMMYNDYRRTAEKYGLDNDDFYFDLAWDFINDADAEPHKVEKYFM